MLASQLRLVELLRFLGKITRLEQNITIFVVFLFTKLFRDNFSPVGNFHSVLLRGGREAAEPHCLDAVAELFGEKSLDVLGLAVKRNIADEYGALFPFLDLEGGQHDFFLLLLLLRLLFTHYF